MSATKNDKTEVNQGLQNIQDEVPRDISQRFSTVNKYQKELHQRHRVDTRSTSVRNNKRDTPNVHSTGHTNQIKRN